MVSLQDYRVRHALYKTDPDLQAAHHRHPWITIFDDHEITNDAYDTGAENHEQQDDPDTTYTGPGETSNTRAEGEFLARRARAFQAYLEWMPIREPGALGRTRTRARSCSGVSGSATWRSSRSSTPGRTAASRCRRPWAPRPTPC